MRAGLTALAAGGALLPLPAGMVERYYSSLVFPLWQRSATAFSNAISFALLDVLLIALVGWIVLVVTATLRRARAGGWLRAGALFVARMVTLAAAIYLAFLLSWGLNYRRLPMTSKVAYDPAAVTPERARDLALATVRDINGLYERARAVPTGADGLDASLPGAFARAQRLLGVGRPALPARPKRTLLDVYFRAAGVEGMTDPFLLETLVVDDLLPFERPFVVAHEWSHLAGFADEGEANFAGWLTCAGASDAARYSGGLFLYTQVLAALDEAERTVVAAGLAPGPRDDLRAAAERMRRNVRPVVADAGWLVYDRYLKANRVDAGTRSYAEVVRLVLGVRLAPR